MDVGVLSATSSSSPNARSRLFSRMWSKGQRWWVAFVDQTCVTISKAGEHMPEAERMDWEAVVSKFVATTNAKAEYPGERCDARLRFPVERASRPPSGPEFADVVKDVATPATPASMAQSSAHASSSVPSNSRAAESSPVDPASTTLRSVSILSIAENDTPDLFSYDVSQESVVVSSREGTSQARASLILCPNARDRTVRQIDVDLLSHFGCVEGEDRPACAWDGGDAVEIVKHVATNFHCLRTVSSMPCWPVPYWKTVYPLHVDAVLNMKSLILNVARTMKRE